MSNITGIKFIQQVSSIPGTGITKTVDLKSAVLTAWTNLANSQALQDIIRTAIQTQVKKTQNGAASILNSFNPGLASQIAYSGAFIPPKATILTSGTAPGEVILANCGTG